MEGDVVTQWGPHITLTTPAILVRRGRLKVGDLVHSSHAGKSTVMEHFVRGEQGQTAYMRLSGMRGPEAYPSDALIPSYTAYANAAAEQRELLEVAGLSKTLRDREATAYRTGYGNGLQEGLADALRMVQHDDMGSLNQLAQELGQKLKAVQRKAGN